jgi:hypothetical protein
VGPNPVHALIVVLDLLPAIRLHVNEALLAIDELAVANSFQVIGSFEEHVFASK